MDGLQEETWRRPLPSARESYPGTGLAEFSIARRMVCGVYLTPSAYRRVEVRKNRPSCVSGGRSP